MPEGKTDFGDNPVYTPATQAQKDMLREALDAENTTQLNARDVENRKRSNHTGSQPIESVAGLSDALNNKPDISPTTGNYRIKNGKYFQIVETGPNPGYRKIWFENGVLQIGELDNE